LPYKPLNCLARNSNLRPPGRNFLAKRDATRQSMTQGPAIGPQGNKNNWQAYRS
jgi:hypothetical protein